MKAGFLRGMLLLPVCRVSVFINFDSFLGNCPVRLRTMLSTPRLRSRSNQKTVRIHFPSVLRQNSRSHMPGTAVFICANIESVPETSLILSPPDGRQNAPGVEVKFCARNKPARLPTRRSPLLLRFCAGQSDAGYCCRENGAIYHTFPVQTGRRPTRQSSKAAVR